MVSKSPSLAATFQDRLGLVQRMIIIPFMLWLFLFTLRPHWKIEREQALAGSLAGESK